MASTNDHPSSAAWQKSNIAQKYLNAENATRLYASILVSKSNLANITSEDETYVLDLACGTGATVQEIYDAVPKDKWDGLKVYGGDVSQPMLDYLAGRGRENGWSGLSTGVVDGNKMEFGDETFTHALCTFGIFIIPNGLAEMYRVTKPGGFVGVTSWVKFQWIPLVQTSISQMSSPPYNPSVSEIEAKFFSNAPWNSPSYIVSLLEDTGFVNVQYEQKALTAGVGSAEMALETLQMPLTVIALFWPEAQREALIREINPIMLKELEKMVVDGAVQMEFEGVCVWGDKP